MSSQNIGRSRRENLEYLIDYVYATQTSFASALKHTSITQPTLSDILRKKRQLHEFEARAIEVKLGIPHYWLDKANWVYEGRNLIAKYKKMTVEEKKFFNEAVAFVVSKCEKA